MNCLKDEFRKLLKVIRKSDTELYRKYFENNGFRRQVDQTLSRIVGM